MAESHGSRGNGYGNKEKSAMSAASDKISGAAPEVQEDLQALRDDVAKLTQQLADLAAAKGNEVWQRARASVDGVVGDVGAKGQEAADAVGEVRDNLMSAIDESIESRPYTTLAISLAAGFVLGALWKR